MRAIPFSAGQGRGHGAEHQVALEVVGTNPDQLADPVRRQFAVLDQAADMPVRETMRRARSSIVSRAGGDHRGACLLLIAQSADGVVEASMHLSKIPIACMIAALMAPTATRAWARR